MYEKHRAESVLHAVLDFSEYPIPQTKKLHQQRLMEFSF